MHQIVVLPEDIRVALEVADARMVASIAQRGAHDVVLPLPGPCGRIAHRIAQSLRATGGGKGAIVMSIALIEPRAFLIMLDVGQLCHLTLQRDHIIVEFGVEGMWISPIQVSLSVGVGIDRRIDVEPVALVPYQRLTQWILERTIRGVGFQDGDTVPVEWGIEVVFPIALYRLDGPGSVLSTAPGDVLQRGYGTVLRPVYHISSAPQKPVVHEETSRTLLVEIRDILR